MIGSLEFLIFGAKLAFIELKQAFYKTPIPYLFDSKHYIRIKTDASGYAIGEALG